MNFDNRSLTVAAQNRCGAGAQNRCYGAARVSKRYALLLLMVCAAQAAPQRIVSTAPGITEILFALGLGTRVVGVTEYCSYPPEVKKLPKIGSFVSPNMEVIVSMRPDIIFVQRTAIQDAAKFVPLRLQTAEVELERIPDIYAAIQTIGNAAGVPDKARTLVQTIQTQLAEIRKRVEGRPKTSAMFIVGRIPGKLEGIIAAGGKSYISEMIEVAGGAEHPGRFEGRLSQGPARRVAGAQSAGDHRHGRARRRVFPLACSDCFGSCALQPLPFDCRCERQESSHRLQFGVCCAGTPRGGVRADGSQRFFIRRRFVDASLRIAQNRRSIRRL